MATTAEDIKNTYPLPVYHYYVSIDGLDDSRFSEVSGLSIERQVISYRDGLSPTKGTLYMPGQAGDVVLTLKRGIVAGQDKLYQWITSIKTQTVDKKNITISLMDETGENPVVTWSVIDAFPTKLDAPAFNATSNEVAIESLELAASDLKVEYH